MLFGCLAAVAGTLLVRSGIFTSGTPDHAQITSIWAFLGVAFGAVATLVGTLLTAQHNRAVMEQARIAADRERRAREHEALLADEAEKRLTLDTVARLLEHISSDSQYLPRARVTGAVAMMIQLRAGAVAIQILGELWSADAVDTMTAVGLVNGVLAGDSPMYDKEVAATILAANASKIIPSREEPDAVTENWPDVIYKTWPAALPEGVKAILIYLLIKVLLAREVEWWRDRLVVPIAVLLKATKDPDVAGAAAYALAELADSGGLAAVGHELDEREMRRIRDLAQSWSQAAAWYLDLVSRFRSWAAGNAALEAVGVSVTALVVDEVGPSE